MTEPDPISETREKLQGYMTLAVTIAARAVEVHMHRRGEQARQQAMVSQEAARAAEAQFRAEASAARYELRPVTRTDWWDKATPEQVAAAYATAHAYGSGDAELAGMARFMEDQIQKRYGVDAGALVAQEERRAAEVRQEASAAQERARLAAIEDQVATVELAMVEAEIVRHEDVLDSLPPHLRAEFESVGEQNVAELLDRIEQRQGVPSIDEVMRRQQRQASVEAATAVGLAAEADHVDAAVHADGVVTPREAVHDVPVAVASWDSADRHEALAQRLSSANVPAEAVQTRLIADAAQGRPAAAATATTGRSSKAPARKSTAQRVPERGRGR